MLQYTRSVRWRSYRKVFKTVVFSPGVFSLQVRLMSVRKLEKKKFRKLSSFLIYALTKSRRVQVGHCTDTLVSNQSLDSKSATVTAHHDCRREKKTINIIFSAGLFRVYCSFVCTYIIIYFKSCD